MAASISFEGKEYDDVSGVETSVRTVQLHGVAVDVITKRKRSPDADDEIEHIDVPQFDVSPLLASGVASSQRAEHGKAVAAALAKLQAAVSEFKRSPDVDATCDAALFGSLVRGSLPAIPADTSGVRTDSDRKYEYPRLAAALAAVRAHAKAVTATTPEGIVDIYAVMTTALERISELLRGTANKTEEAAIAVTVELVLAAIDRFIALAVPPTGNAHATALGVDLECGVFEHKRATVDWSSAMIAEETALYQSVDRALADLRAVGGACESFYGEISKAREAIRATAGADAETAARGEQDACRGRIAQLEGFGLREGVAYGKTVGAVQAEIDRVTATKLELRAAADSKAAQIEALLAGLAADREALWESDKRLALLEAGLGALAQVHTQNRDGAAALIAAAVATSGDIEATVKAAHVAERMATEAGAQFEAVARDSVDAAIDGLSTLLQDQMHLVARKYHKTALCVFAANSRVEMRNQEREGMLVKKQRCNAAQDIDGVATCNRAVEEIEARIVKEIAAKDSMEGDLGELAAQWGEAYRSLGGLPVAGIDELVGGFKAEWLALIAALQSIEADQHRKMFLSDVLDASFLSSM